MKEITFNTNTINSINIINNKFTIDNRGILN